MFTCDVFIYSQVSDGCCTVPVYLDEEFLENVVLSTENFYFHHYLPVTDLAFTKEKNGATYNQAKFFDK